MPCEIEVNHPNGKGQARLEIFCHQVKHLLTSKGERKFTPVGGVEGVYSMKRLDSSITYAK